MAVCSTADGRLPVLARLTEFCCLWTAVWDSLPWDLSDNNRSLNTL